MIIDYSYKCEIYSTTIRIIILSSQRDKCVESIISNVKLFRSVVIEVYSSKN